MTTAATQPAAPRRGVPAVLRPGEAAFDAFGRAWEADASRRLRAWLIVATFAGTAGWIELARLGLVPAGPLEGKPFGYAIHTAFTLVLITEVVAMVLSLPRSVAESVGKQFEIFSLILLRKAFEEFSPREDALAWQGTGAGTGIGAAAHGPAGFDWNSPVMHMMADIAGAVAVFALVVVYAKLQLHRPITRGEDDQRSFVSAKKSVAMFLLGAFAATGAVAAWDYFGRAAEPLPLFKTFYVTLIFTDVLIVLLAMRYSARHEVVFRNAGFAACTLLVRVAMAAPPYASAALGVAAAALLVAIAAAYRFATLSHAGPGASGGRSR